MKSKVISRGVGMKYFKNISLVNDDMYFVLFLLGEDGKGKYRKGYYMKPCINYSNEVGVRKYFLTYPFKMTKQLVNR